MFDIQNTLALCSRDLGKESNDASTIELGPTDVHAHVSDIPAEILQSILDFTVAPTFLLTPGLTIREDAWLIYMKIKRSLPLVCRSWYASANPMLYRDIALRSVGQVAALLETLQNAPTLASLITSLSFACYVAEHHEEAYANDATLLLQLCQAARSVSFIAMNAPLSLPQLLPLLNPACPPLPHLTRLHLNEGFDSEALLSDQYKLVATPGEEGWYIRTQPLRPRRFLVGASHHLVELSLPFVSAMQSAPALTFPSLVSFGCLVNCIGSDSFGRITSIWEMPRLQRFSISLLGLGSPYLFQYMGTRDYLPRIGSFVARHGAQLRYLHILDHAHYTNDHRDLMLDIQSALDHCPRLEHLVLPSNVRPTPALHHPTVRWIDIWMPHRGDASHCITRKGIAPFGQTADSRAARSGDQKYMFPRLQGGRAIDAALSFFRDLPWILRPDTWAGVTAELKYPGIDVKHDKMNIWRADLQPEYTAPQGDGMDEERMPFGGIPQESRGWPRDRILFEYGTYVWTDEEGSDGDMSSVHSSDSSWLASDEETNGVEPMQWTHDDILRVFRDPDNHYADRLEDKATRAYERL
ncbi:uncharacterized protein SCHCODRAFT_02562157 [Schizophyllum commune H4-8]|nr:uncharacterized protein SCHCODRAFT_02562157 [Schizophyllum commune H4-8]KAI5900084.1 hypothetical protein SCHCODRAFT_02562157 [Schizophyllum commune H4-8]